MFIPVKLARQFLTSFNKLIIEKRMLLKSKKISRFHLQETGLTIKETYNKEPQPFYKFVFDIIYF